VDGGVAQWLPVVDAAHHDGVHRVAVQAQPAGRFDVDDSPQRPQNLQPGAERQAHEVVDGAELAQVLPVAGRGERAAVGDSVDHAVGHEVLEGAAYGLAADLVLGSQLGFGRQ
jgi:hypothetical protein